MSRASNRCIAVISILMAVSCLLPLRAGAVCLSCWTVHGVSMELRDGRRIEGYVLWNQSWVDEETQTPFPAVLLEPLKAVREVRFFDELHRIVYPEAGRVVSAKGPMLIGVESIKSVALRPHSLDGSQGAGEIPVVSRRVIEMLKQDKPISFCHGEGGLSDVYWVSYNGTIDERELAILCKDPWVSLLIGNESLEANNIVRLEFYYD